MCVLLRPNTIVHTKPYAESLFFLVFVVSCARNCVLAKNRVLWVRHMAFLLFRLGQFAFSFGNVVSAQRLSCTLAFRVDETLICDSVFLCFHGRPVSTFKGDF